MSSGEKQLSEDFEQVEKLLKSYSNIKIISTEGDPPEQYDIEYTIKGYKTNPDGSASPDNKHQVRINLPFGYPHFPPTAKPITPIFHPDIDPDAIRIADFWQENNSLPELIIHIGQMICGNHSTKEEPFNQNAFEWFKERKSWLPFDILEPSDEDEVQEESEADVADAPASSEDTDKTFVPATDLDILKDDIDFPFDEDEEDALSIDIGDEVDEGSELEKTVDDLDLDFGDESSDSSDQEKSADEEIDSLLNLGTEDTTDEVPFDFGDLEEAQPEEPVEDIDLDLGNKDLDSVEEEDEDISNDISLDFGDHEKATEAAEGTSESSDLFDLETESLTEKAVEEIPLEFESDDFSSAFDEEAGTTTVESENVDISLDDLAGIDQEIDSLDFGLDDESIDIGDEATVDLSGLDEESDSLDFGLDGEEKKVEASSDDSVEEEEILSTLNLDDEEKPKPTSESSDGEEEQILSALSLDEEFDSEGNLAERSEAIRNLIEQKQIFAAKKVFADLSAPEELPDKIEHEQAIANAISEAEELFKKADKHERKGEFEKAGIILDLVANIATDFPGLDHARNRIRESIMGDSKVKPEIAAVEEKEEEITEEKTPTTKKKQTKAKLGFKVPVRLLVIILVLIILGGIGAGAGYVFMNDSEHIENAQTIYTKAEQLVKKKEFKASKKEFDAARTTLEKIVFFHEKDKESILRQINSTTNTSLFREGLKGRVLYGDIYVSVETAQAIDKLNSQKKYAERVTKEGKLDTAIKAYEKSLPFAEKAGFENEQQAIKQKILELKKNLALSNAQQSEKEQDWLNAKNSYQKALEFGKGISEPKEQEIISRQFGIATYHYGLTESMKAINDSQWQKSIDALQDVKKVLEEYPEIVTEVQKTEVDKLLIQSHLYFYLSEAKEAYDNKVWKQAIETYNDAIALLNENIDLLGEKGSDNIEKIKKTILTTNVAKEQAKVEDSKASNELDRTVEHYEAIVNLIEDSSFKDDEILSKILVDARTRTKEIKKQLLINKKEKWLTDNYDSIFRDNYPSARSSELMNPKVRFVKRENNIMIFNLSCTERKQGSKFRLELYYQNDLLKDAWSLYSGKIEKEE